MLEPERRRRWRSGIRLRATLIATAVVAAALVVGGALLVLLVHRSLLGSLDAAGRARAQDVAAAAAAGRGQPTVASTGEESSVVQVVDATGAVVASSSNITGEAVLLPRPPTSRTVQVLARANLPIVDPGQRFRLVAQPVPLPTGPGWVYVATSQAQVDLTTTRLAGLLAIGLPLLLAVVALATWRAVGRGLRPVEQIRSVAASIGGRPAGARVPVPPTGDEVGRLAETVNAMLGRIDEAAARQREFVGDASHELRSPLATLQTELDVARAHPSNEAPDVLLSRLGAQVARMAELLNGLLVLARADEGAVRGSPRTVDLDELVLREARRLRGHGLQVEMDGPDAARVQGLHGDLERLLRNLGDNAATHARTRVLLGLRTEQGRAVLRVHDDGPGIPAADRERVFERFTRLDTSRSRPTVGGGTGLGLAICRQIVEQHAGSIYVADGPGATVVVNLPLSEPTLSSSEVVARAARLRTPGDDPRR